MPWVCRTAATDAAPGSHAQVVGPWDDGRVSVARFAPVAEGDYDVRWLTEAEQARHDRLRLAEDRAAYLAAHVLVRSAAAELLGADPTELVVEQRCPDCGGTDHGRPTIAGADIHISLSHTRGWVAAVAAEQPVGVDVERVRPVVAGVLTRTLSEAEQAWLRCQPDPERAFARLWVRKEALVKAGHGRLAAASALDALGTRGPAEQIAGLHITDWHAADAVGVYVIAGA